MIETNKIICGDALEELKKLPDNSIDLILTDPPYPDYHTEIYGYKKELITVLNKFKCPQLIFWSSKVDFPLDYTAVHIWDKKVGCGSQYERIFERSGGKEYKVFRCYLINSTVAKSYHGLGEEYTAHPSQKPIKLIRELILKYTKEGDIILDPYMGTGVVPLVCKQLKRKYIGIEINPEYYKIAKKRLAQSNLLDLNLNKVKLGYEGEELR